MPLSLEMKDVLNILTCSMLLISNSLAVGFTSSICSTWDMDHDSVNNLDASVILWERNDCPNFDCAILCDRDPSCRSFFHHPSLERCLASSSYKRGLPTDKAMQQGWNYYTRPQNCNEGYVYNQSMDLCYKVHLASETCNNAMITCESERAKLMIIRNDAEFKFIREVMNTILADQIWIGLRAVSANREWKWWNGQTASYTPWNTGEPNNEFGLENCVVVRNGLNDVPCSALKSFVCQRFI